MAADRLVTSKKARKRPKKSVPLRPAEVRVTPSHQVELDAPSARASVFEPRTFLGKLISANNSREYKDKQVIFSQGDPADAVFYLRAGKVKLAVVSKRGKEAVIAILPEHSFFGEGCLIGQPLRISTASSVQRSSVIRVKKSAMLNLLRQDRTFAESFLTYVLTRNIRMEADLVDHLFNSSEKRLARLLLLLANFGQESKPVPVVAKMDQETLAEMIGTTRSRVSFFMNRFRKLGFIDYNGNAMHVHSSLISVILHD